MSTAVLNGDEPQWREPEFENIPKEIQSQGWAGWIAKRRNGKPGKWNKAPRSLITGEMIGTDKPELFGTFEQAKTAYATGRYTGVGVLLTGNGIVGVDIDDFDATFKEKPAVKAWVTTAIKAGAYCERSPSGNGLRLFMRGKLPGTGRKSGSLEIYDNGRFLTVTGAVMRFKS